MTERLFDRRRAVLVAVLLAPAACATVRAAPPNSIQRLDGSYISFAAADSAARSTLAAAGVTGAQLAVVRRGRLVWSGAYGLRRLDPQLAMNSETTTWAASITKGVFATYVMQLVERGEFDLDRPIAAQLPQPLTSYAAYAEKASELVNDPAWPSITPRMLLAHTSGLLNFASLEPDGKMRLHFAPVSRYHYSGEGINLVQFVIEQQKGKSLDTLMHDAIFQPLAMTRTGMIYRRDFEANVADRHAADGKFIARTRRFPARGAGSLTTSAEDLARFAAALFAGALISPANRSEMLRPYVTINTLHQFPLAADEPPGQEAAAVGLAYGMGWGLLTKTRFGPAFFKEGHGDGAQNYMICFERTQSCMILLTNSDNGELAFRPLLETIFGNTVTPWEWHGYTPEYIRAARQQP